MTSDQPESEKNTHSWSKLKLVFFSACVVLFLLILVEVTARIIFWLQYGKYNTTLSIQWNPRWTEDTATIWTNRPFYLESTKQFQYNAAGMRAHRGDVFMPPKKENDLWVFLFGGSAMAGMGSNRNGEWLRITGIYDHPPETSIDGYLEKLLQNHFPDKKVRVFNAAVSGHSIYQSRLRYLQLCKYKPDWVVSMDLVNEPSSLESDETTLTHLKDQWRNNPARAYLNDENSWNLFKPAFYFLLNRFVYNFRETKNEKNVSDSVEYYTNKWFAARSGSPSYSTYNTQIARAVSCYTQNLSLFVNTLEERQQNFLLLVQPHLSQRDTARLCRTERATYNYYNSLSYDTTNTFVKAATEAICNNSFNNTFGMQEVNSWNTHVFVDYCHFTKEANFRIAQEIYNYILSGGKLAPFNGFRKKSSEAFAR